MRQQHLRRNIDIDKEKVIKSQYKVLNGSIGNSNPAGLRAIFKILLENCVVAKPGSSMEKRDYAIDLKEEDRKKIRDAWERINPETRIILFEVIKTRIVGGVRYNLLLSIGQTEGMKIRESDPIPYVAPLPNEGSDGLKSSLHQLDEIFEKSETFLLALHTMYEIFNTQQLTTAQDLNESMQEIREIGKVLPECTDEILALHQALVDAARETFALLRPLANMPAVSEDSDMYDPEFIRFIAVLEQHFCKLFQKKCSTSASSIGLAAGMEHIFKESVVSALTVARITTLSKRNLLITSPEVLNDTTTPAWVKNRGEVESEWFRQFERIKKSYQNVAEKTHSHTCALPEAAIAALLLQRTQEAVVSALELWRISSTFNLRGESNSTSLRDNRELVTSLPRFVSLMGYAEIPFEGTPTPLQKTPGSLSVSFQPYSVPLFSICCRKSGADFRGWIMNMDDGITPNGSVVPFKDIFPDTLMLQFTESFQREANACSVGIMKGDSILTRRLPDIRESGGSIFLYHDTTGELTFTERDTAEAFASDLMIEGDASKLCIDKIGEMYGEQCVPESIRNAPALISWISEMPEGETQDLSDIENLAELKRLLLRKYLWSASDVQPLFNAAGISQSNGKNKHWKVHGPRGTHTLPSAPLKSHEWHASFLYELISEIGDVESACTYLEEIPT